MLGIKHSPCLILRYTLAWQTMSGTRNSCPWGHISCVSIGSHSHSDHRQPWTDQTDWPTQGDRFKFPEIPSCALTKTSSRSTQTWEFSLRRRTQRTLQGHLPIQVVMPVLLSSNNTVLWKREKERERGKKKRPFSLWFKTIRAVASLEPVWNSSWPTVL